MSSSPRSASWSACPSAPADLDEEEQATAFGGTLLLPRVLLVAAVGRGLGPDDIATKYNVTVEMARYRCNTTGVAKQVRRSTL